MAAEVGSAPVNGYGHQNTYGAMDQSYGHQANASTSTTGYGAAPVASSTSQQSEISKEEVAWYFVESYYTTMSRNPEKLHLFFNKRSQFVSGVEEEKSSIAVGSKAIKDRLTNLNFDDCKVRVTNVDSQGTDTNIVIQVIGEMSNKSQPHRKFVQTFVLAGQTNGYFVLNDIFRYIKEDDEEAEGEIVQQASEDAAVDGVQEPVPTAVDSAYSAEPKETIQNEEEVAEVDKKLEQVQDADEEAEIPTAAVNGTPASEATGAVEAEDAPVAAVSAPETKSEEPEASAAQEDLKPEEPKDPAPTPSVEMPQSAAAPSAPPKPAVPRTWAQLASGNRAAAAAAAAGTQAPRTAPAASQAKQSAPASATTQSTTAAAASAPAAAAREASPDSNKEGSTGGWQTAGSGHDRKQSRAQNSPAVSQDGRVRAFVKNVTDEVDAEALKSALSKFGEVVYFDVARQKKAAFVEYKTVAGFQAAVNANPHRIGTEEIWVEERRMPNAFNARGGARGGRGSFDGRPAARGDYKGTGAPRGNYVPRGRGNGNVTPRGGRGGAQAA